MHTSTAEPPNSIGLPAKIALVSQGSSHWFLVLVDDAFKSENSYCELGRRYGGGSVIENRAVVREVINVEGMKREWNKLESNLKAIWDSLAKLCLGILSMRRLRRLSPIFDSPDWCVAT